MPTINDAMRDILKIFWEKEKMVFTSIFIFFKQYFLSFPKQIFSFSSLLFCRLQMLSILTGENFVVW